MANEPGEKFRGECGASLTEVRRSSAPLTATSLTADSRSSRAVPPKHLARKIVETKAAREGERKQVTVLFADVKGSMELAERPDPEEWSAIMQRFFTILADGVERVDRVEWVDSGRRSAIGRTRA